MHKIICILNKKKKNPGPSEEKDQVNIFSELARFLEQKVTFFFFGVYIILGRVDQTKSRGQIMKNQMNNAKKSFKLIPNVMCKNQLKQN